MNNKKVQAQMQIDVSFLGDTTKLVKQIESVSKNLNLDAGFSKQFGNNLVKSFKEVYSNIDKMTEGLSKKGLSSKQYSAFFNEMNSKLQESIKFTTTLKSSLKDLFNSEENKKALKDLENYRKQLEEIKKLSSSQRGAVTRQATAASKMKEETGIDYNLSKRMLANITARKVNNQDLTKTQKEWADNNKLDEAKLKRVLDLYKQIVAQAQKIKGYDDKAKGITGQGGVGASTDFLEKQIQKLENSVITPGDSKRNMGVANQIEQLGKNLDTVIQNQLPQFNNELQQSEIEAKKLAEASNTIREILGQFGIVFSAASIVRGFKDLVKSSFDFYKSLDSALNQIYVVSSLTSSSVNDLKSNFINMAKETGMAIDDVTRSAVLFYQQGLNTKEVLIMTEVTSQFAKVAGIDATDAADKLTAAVNGYCLAAEDAAMVADKFNKVAAASAADINELSTAFSKAAAQANQAGVSMDNYLAYIATMEEATREAPENIGTSLKTIFSRMQQVKEAGTSEDGETDVNKVETALKSVGIQLRDTEGQLRDLEDVFDELGPKWNSLDRNTQAYLGTIIAGTRQQSRFITLMQNWDRVLDLSEQSANSAGMQALMHAKAMDSIESKVQQFQVTWQEFVSNMASSDLFKGLISGLTKLLDVFSSGNKPVMLLATAIGLLSTKLKDLQLPLVNKVKDIAKTFKTIMGTVSGKTFTTQGEKDAALAQVQGKQVDVQSQIDVKTAQLNKLTADMQATKVEEEQKQIAEQRKQVEQDIVNLKQQQTQLGKEEKEISEQQVMSKAQAVGKGLIAAGTAANIVGMAAGQKDDNLGGVIGSVGTTMTAIGQFATGNWIGGIASTATAAYQIFETVDKWDENIKARVDEAVNNVNNALETTVNQNTGIKATDALLKKYDTLSRKLYKTTAEQQELNSTVQELADTYGIDIITDAYGNLSINIGEVNDALDEQKAKREEALKELDKTERESMAEALSGLGNNTTVEEYMKQLFSTSRSQYKALLSGAEDGLTEQARGVSNTVAQAFSSNLKTAIVKEVENNADEHILEGLANGVVNLEKDINNTLGKDKGAWTELYSRIDFLEQNINDMTFAEAQEYLDNFYENWKDKIGLTQQQWDVLKDSINNTVFQNDSMLNFFKEVNELEGKASGKYWNNDTGTGKLDKLKNQLETAYGAYNDSVSWMNKSGQFVGLNTADSSDFETYVKNLEKGKDSTYGYGINDWFRGKAGDRAADDVDNIAKAYKEAYKERENFLQTYADEHNLDGVNDAEKYINALTKVRDSLENTTAATTNYLGAIDNLYNTEGMKGYEAEQYADSLKQVAEAMDGMDPMSTDADKYNFLARYYEENQGVMEEGVRKQWEAILEKAFNNLEVATPKSLKSIGEELKSMGSDLVKMNDILADFKDTGGLALDTFIELADIIDSIDLKELGKLDPSAVDSYINAIENLNLAYDANSGYITANGDALTSLQEIQEIQTKAKIAGLISELKASKATTETQIAYIDAQIAATDAAIAVAQMDSTNTVTSDEIKSAANATFSEHFGKSMEAITGSYENDATNQGQWSTTILSNLGVVADAWSKYFKGIANGSTESLDAIKGKAQELTKSGNYGWEGGGKSSGINLDDYGEIKKGSAEQKKLLGDLEAYKGKLENTKKSYQATLALTEKEIGLLENMLNSDLSKLGQAGKGKGKELEQYLGKLKEIYNILNRIAMLEHRLSTLDTYSETAIGDNYGSLLKERLSYNYELMDQYDFLVREQKAFTNGAKEAIKNSAVGDVFDFDKFGQIIINFEKYNKLQDTAVQGEKSLKQQADEWYETYTQMFDELKEDFDNYIKYLKQTIDLYQEMIDKYIEMEDKAAAAVKEIYQKILDTKLEAIDKEKEAIEDLRKAREEARKDQENAKAVSGLQTSLQRAMMDTSGASDVALIKAQNDLDDKLSEIAEDKYSKMLDDIITKLDDEKEALQDEFDQLWDNMDWLFEWLDEEVMRDEERLTELLTQTDEWNTSSAIQRAQLLQEWDTSYKSYMAGLQGGRTILDIFNTINTLREKTIEMDEALKNNDTKIGQEIIAAIHSINVGGGSGGSGGGGGGYSGGGGSGGSGGSGSSGTNSTATPKLNGTSGGSSYAFGIGDKVKSNVGALMDGYKYNGNGDLVTPPTQSGWDTNKLWTSGETMFVTRRTSYNGLNYYGLAFSKGAKPILWANGHQLKYKNGGFADFTGPAWLDGTKSKPEAVLNALQTEHFIKFTDALDKMYSSSSDINGSTSNVNIASISFNVESMSSPEDGEKAFNMFVDKFKEIGNRTGIKIDSFKNNL